MSWLRADEEFLDITVREFVTRAVRAILKHSTQGPDFDKRIDLHYDVEVWDKKMGRKHWVRARVKVTAASLIFEDESPTAPSQD